MHETKGLVAKPSEEHSVKNRNLGSGTLRMENEVLSSGGRS